ncbi:MAG: hypothetical protein ACYC9S_01810 [Leptospirales bacterium]
MLLWKIRVPDALFTPPIPDKHAFNNLIEALGVYQGVFRNNGYLELYSRYQTRIWPEADHDRTYEDLLNFLGRSILPSERSQFALFQEKAQLYPDSLSSNFSFFHPGTPDFSHMGISLRHSPWGMHVVFAPGRSKKESEHVLASHEKVSWESLWEGLSSWFEEEEIERLAAEAVRLIPEEIADGIVLYRTTITGPPGNRMLQHLVYTLKKGEWHRRIQEEETIPHSMKMQAYRDKHELFLRTNMFLGGVFPVFRIDIEYRTLESYGIYRFNHFLERYSQQSVALARSFSTAPFQFAKYWTGMGYSMDGLIPIASILSPESPMSLVVLAIWGLSVPAVEEIKKTCRLSDPLFFDWEKGMGLILLRDCSLENAEKIVYPNLERKLSVPVDFPVTVKTFLESR